MFDETKNISHGRDRMAQEKNALIPLSKVDPIEAFTKYSIFDDLAAVRLTGPFWKTYVQMQQEELFSIAETLFRILGAEFAPIFVRHKHLTGAVLNAYATMGYRGHNALIWKLLSFVNVS
jgi:hypothetical protein